ncbi:MAG: twin-arginine translocase TatA/TatE family subunit [Desulfovibrionaceae bacterium]|nr:twin-arginine translocase TatA/TatE family subunit [Desulfovibrionaceae bacterium]
MFGIGSTELLLIFVVALVMLGPKNLLSISKTLGKVMGEFRRVSTDFQRTLNAEVAQEEHEERKKQAEKEYFAKDDTAKTSSTAKPAPQATADTQAPTAATAGAQASTGTQAAASNPAGAQNSTPQAAATPEANAVPAPPAGSPLAEAIAVAAHAADQANSTAPKGEKA